MSLHYRPLPGKHEPRKLHLLTKTLLLLYNQTQNIFRPPNNFNLSLGYH